MEALIEDKDYKKAQAAIRRIFADVRLPQGEVKLYLKDLKEEIEMMLARIDGAVGPVTPERRIHSLTETEGAPPRP